MIEFLTQKRKETIEKSIIHSVKLEIFQKFHILINFNFHKSFMYL